MTKINNKGHHVNPTMTKMFMNPNMMFTKINTLLNLSFIYYEKNILLSGHYVIYIIIII